MLIDKKCMLNAENKHDRGKNSYFLLDISRFL